MRTAAYRRHSVAVELGAGPDQKTGIGFRIFHGARNREVRFTLSSAFAQLIAFDAGGPEFNIRPRKAK